MSETGVVVVGAGMAGLVSALLLAQRGVRVTVVDSADNPGGKMRQLHVDGPAIAGGPTVFTTPRVFQRIFDSPGPSPARALTTSPLSDPRRHPPALLARPWTRWGLRNRPQAAGSTCSWSTGMSCTLPPPEKDG